MNPTDQPTPNPPPDPNKPYVLIAGTWYLIAMDSTDGVPDDLSYVDNHEQGESK